MNFSNTRSLAGTYVQFHLIININKGLNSYIMIIIATTITINKINTKYNGFLKAGFIQSKYRYLILK